MTGTRRMVCALCGIALLAVAANAAVASTITSGDIVAIPAGIEGSGNRTLNLRMFTFSGSEIKNSDGTFDGDNANNNLPKGNGGGDASFAESYVTTAGELKAYYGLNFAAGSIHEIVVFLHLNETNGAARQTNTLAKLDVILNPTSIQGDPDPLGDVTSEQQVGIAQVYQGGTAIASLNPQSFNLPVGAQGAGFADYAICTGIDPFALNDADILLFNVSMDILSGGADEIFISGRFSSVDVPEPATPSLLALGAVAIIRRRRTA